MSMVSAPKPMMTVRTSAEIGAKAPLRSRQRLRIGCMSSTLRSHARRSHQVARPGDGETHQGGLGGRHADLHRDVGSTRRRDDGEGKIEVPVGRSEEHTSELQSLMRNSYAVFCLKKKKKKSSCNTPKYQYKYQYKCSYTKTRTYTVAVHD